MLTIYTHRKRLGPPGFTRFCYSSGGIPRHVQKLQPRDDNTEQSPRQKAFKGDGAESI